MLFNIYFTFVDQILSVINNCNSIKWCTWLLPHSNPLRAFLFFSSFPKSCRHRFIRTRENTSGVSNKAWDARGGLSRGWRGAPQLGPLGERRAHSKESLPEGTGSSTRHTSIRGAPPGPPSRPRGGVRRHGTGRVGRYPSLPRRHRGTRGPSPPATPGTPSPGTAPRGPVFSGAHCCRCPPPLSGSLWSSVKQTSTSLSLSVFCSGSGCA